MRHRILLVEDNAADVRLLRQALRDTGVPLELQVADDGEAATEILFQRGAHRNASRPDLVLLDLNLPKKGGLDVLREVKLDESLRGIPVMVLSSSRRESDVNRAYEYGANLYVSKPSDLDDLEDMARFIAKGWLRYGVLPTDSPSRG